jgi:AcrR family transcriptional regulator
MLQKVTPRVGLVKSRTKALSNEKPDRRAAILLAAEKLFAQQGYHSVSLRDIAQEAQVPLALVGYYFGPKQDLFYAIFEHWNDTLDARLAALKQAMANAGKKHRLREIVQAFVEPVLKLRASAEGEYYALLVARELMYNTQEADRVLREFFDPMAHAFIDAIEHSFAGIKRTDAAWAYQFAVGALLHNISDTRVTRLARSLVPLEAEQGQQMLIDFIEHGISACLLAQQKEHTKKKTPHKTTLRH